jgi:hypothetical protein
MFGMKLGSRGERAGQPRLIERELRQAPKAGRMWQGGRVGGRVLISLLVYSAGCRVANRRTRRLPCRAVRAAEAGLRYM